MVHRARLWYNVVNLQRTVTPSDPNSQICLIVEMVHRVVMREYFSLPLAGDTTIKIFLVVRESRQLLNIKALL